MRLLVYYNANYKRFDVIYYTKRIRHRKSSDVDKYNRIFIQEISLYKEENWFKCFVKHLKI